MRALVDLSQPNLKKLLPSEIKKKASWYLKLQ
jgi:hypothetical protein